MYYSIVEKVILSPPLFLGGLVINSQRRLILPLIISFIIFVAVVFEDVVSPYFKIFGDYEAGISYAISTITILIFPITPIIYGWVTKDKVGSIVVGAVPIFVSLFFGNLFFGNLIYNNGFSISRFFTILVYTVSLATLGGLAGYFSSKKEFKYLIISIFFGTLWISVFLSGID